jgi:hypothetical protein
MNFFRYSLVLVLTILSSVIYGQFKFSIRIMSLIDSLPISNTCFTIDNNKTFKTDSSGFFSFDSKRSKITVKTGILDYEVNLTLTNPNYEYKFYTIDKCDSALAEFEFRKNKSRFFCGTGFAPMAMRQIDYEFEKKFQISYFVIGDFVPFTISILDMIKYNKVVSNYLDLLYGKKWRNNIRQDILGVTKSRQLT